MQRRALEFFLVAAAVAVVVAVWGVDSTSESTPQPAIAKTPKNQSKSLPEWKSLYDQAWNAIAETDWKKAEGLLNQALVIAQANPTALKEATTHDLLGMVFHSRGDIERAEAEYKAAISTCMEQEGQGRNLAVFQQRMAIFLSDNKRFDEAERWIEDCLVSYEKALGSESSELATRCNSMGSLYLQHGHLERADQLFSKAQRIIAKSGAQPRVKEALSANLQELARRRESQ